VTTRTPEERSARGAAANLLNDCADVLEASSTAQPAGRNRSHGRGGIRLDCKADERSLPSATGWDHPTGCCDFG
jgi:hypothetical protein